MKSQHPLPSSLFRHSLLGLGLCSLALLATAAPDAAQKGAPAPAAAPPAPATFAYQWGEPGTGTGQFRALRGIAAYERKSAERSLIVVADGGMDLVRSYTANMMFIDKWGKRGSGPGEFKEPRGVAVDAEGNLWVVDAYNHRLVKTAIGTATLLDQPGAVLQMFGEYGKGPGQLDTPTGVTVEPSGHILVVDTENHRIQRFDATGKFVSSFGKVGSGPGELRRPTYAALDSAGNIFVADSDNNRIQKFAKDGRFLAQIGNIGSAPGLFAEPKGLTLDANDNLWVVDRRNHRLQKFSADGKLLGVLGGQGGQPGKFNFPEAVAIDVDGRIFVTDGMNGRIQVFKPNPLDPPKKAAAADK